MGSRRRVIITVAAVVVAHVVVLLGLASVKPSPLKKVIQPQSIEVKFVQLDKPKPQQQPAPKPEPKPLPKPELKEVPVVKEPPKPQSPVKPKHEAVIATKAESSHAQLAVPAQPDTSPATKVDTPAPAPAKADPAPTAPAQPIQVDGLAYGSEVQIEPPSDDDLGGQDRLVVVRLSIDASGHVDDVKLLKSCGVAMLDNRVIRAARYHTFKPKRVNGVAVPVITNMNLKFTLSSSQE